MEEAGENVLMFMGDDGNNNIHMRDVNETAESVIIRPTLLIK